MSSSVELRIDGNVFDGWERCALDFDMEDLSASFSVSARDKNNVLGELSSSVPCVVYVVNGDQKIKVIDGYTTERDRSISATEHTVSISGSDKLIDFVECSTLIEARTWNKKKFSKIIADLLSPFGLTLNTASLLSDPIVDKLTIQSGETAFDTAERLCRSQAVMPLSNFDSDLVLGYSADFTQRSIVDLELGVNIKAVAEAITWGDRYSDYVALAQAPGNGKRWTKAMIEGKATAQDRGVTRYRPKLFIAEGKSKNADLVKRVSWEAQIRAGRGSDWAVTTSGWFQKDVVGVEHGLWEKNKRVRLLVPAWGLDKETLITGVSMTLDENGHQTSLGLRHPDIFKANPTEEIDLT